MSFDSTAKNYAEALFGLGKDTGKLDIFQANAMDLLRVLEASSELRVALTHPNIVKADRKAIAQKVLANSGYDAMFVNFVKLVVERGRLTHYAKIVHEFMALRDAMQGIVRGDVYVSSPLSETQKTALKARVEQQLSRKVVIREHLDASVIGGLRLEIDGRVYDSSVKHHLEKMRASMRI